MCKGLQQFFIVIKCLQKNVNPYFISILNKLLKVATSPLGLKDVPWKA